MFQFLVGSRMRNKLSDRIHYLVHNTNFLWWLRRVVLWFIVAAGALMPIGCLIMGKWTILGALTGAGIFLVFIFGAASSAALVFAVVWEVVGWIKRTQRSSMCVALIILLWVSAGVVCGSVIAHS